MRRESLLSCHAALQVALHLPSWAMVGNARRQSWQIRQSRQRGMCNLQILLPLRASESHPHRQNICLTFSSLADGPQKFVINSCLVPVQWECAQHLPPPRAALFREEIETRPDVPALLLSHPRRRQVRRSFPPPEPPHFELAEGPAAGRGGRGARFVGPVARGGAGPADHDP